MQQVNTRPKTAVYSTTGNKRARRAVELLRYYCLLHDLNCVFYLDKGMPKPDKPSAWQRLLNDVSTSKIDGVITWMPAPDMPQFCASYNTKFAEVDIYGWFASLRTPKDDTLELHIG